MKLIEAYLIPIKTNNNISSQREEQKSKQNEEYEKSYKIGLGGLDLIFNYIPIFFYFFTFSNIEILLTTWVAFGWLSIKAWVLAL